MQILNEQQVGVRSGPSPITKRIVLDNMRPYHRLVVFLMIAIFMMVWFLLQTHVFPQQFIIKTNQSQLATSVDSCMNPSSFQNKTLVCEPFEKANPQLGLILRNICPLNQFALISLQFLNHSNKTVHGDLKQNITVILYSLESVIVQKGFSKYVKKEKVGEKNMLLTNQESHQSFLYAKLPLQHVIGLYRNLQETNYLLVIKFDRPQKILSQQLEPYLQAYLTNPSSALLIIIIRAALFVTSALTFGVYLYLYLKTSENERIIEQKLVFYLSVSLLVFNDPLYFYTILYPNSVNTVISLIFFIQMPAILLFYLICSLRKIISHQLQNLKSLFQLFSKTQFILFFSTYFAIIANLYSQIAYSDYQSELLLYPFTISPTLSALSILWLVAVVGYIGYLLLRSCSSNKTLWRTNGWTSLLVFLVLALILYFFLLEILWPQKSRSLLFVTFVALMINIICICNQILYMPLRGNQINGIEFTKLRDEQLAEGETTDIIIE